MKSLVVILGLLVAAVQAAPGERFSDDPTPLNVYMPIIEGAPKVQAPKIIDGLPAVEGQFPHQCVLFSSSFCGCVLLSSTWVLTAAHCVADFSFQVILGRLQWNGPGGVIVMTSMKFVHPDFILSTLTNDVALLSIPAVPLGVNIQPVVLPTPSDIFDTFEGETAIVSGFGETADGAGVNPNLNYATVQIIGNTLCGQFYGSLIHQSTICASGEGGRGPCVGDSGGPLVLHVSGNTYKLIGVVSFVSAAGCASGFPSGYARVTYFREWIRSHTGF